MKTLEKLTQLLDALGVPESTPISQLGHQIALAWCKRLEHDPEFVWVILSILS